MKLINDNLQHIKALCQKHKVSKLFVFGSVLTPRFNNQSDVDLLVDFHKEEVDDYFNNFFDLKYALEKLLGKNVDLVEGQTIKNPYLNKDIDQHKVLIYG
jgi:predicted nucleotidyltransferase